MTLHCLSTAIMNTQTPSYSDDDGAVASHEIGQRMAAAEFGRAISAHKEVRSKLYLCNNENIHTAESNQCAHRFQACNQFSAVERINCVCLCVQQCTQTAICA